MRNIAFIFLTRSAYCLLVIVIVLSGLITGVLSSTSGSVWLINTVINHYSAPNQISINHIEGSILNGLSLHQVSFQQETHHIHIELLTLDGQALELFSGRIILNAIQANDITYQSIPASTAATSLPKQNQLDSHHIINLSLPIELKKIALTNLILKMDETSHSIKKIEAQAKLTSKRIILKQLNMTDPSFQVSLQGLLENAEPHSIKADVQWDYFDLNQKTMSGQLNLGGDLKTINLQHKMFTPLAIATEGKINLHDKPQATLSSVINNVYLPNKNGQSIAEIKQATMVLNGWLDDIVLNINANVSNANIPEAHLTVIAQGNTQAFKISKLSLQSEKQKIHGLGTADIVITPHFSLKTDIALSLVDNQFNLHGSIAEKINLNWSLNARTLHHFWPELNGSIISKGYVKGKRDQPIINGTISADKIMYRNYLIDHATINAQAKATSNKITLQANNLSLGEQRIERLDAMFNGNIDQHKITASLKHAIGLLTLNITGSYQKPLWQGHLNGGTLASRSFGRWALAQTSQIQWSPNIAVIDHHCWQYQDQIAQICSKAQHTSTNDIELESELRKLPLSIFKPYINDPYTIDGYANGTMTLSGPIESFSSRIDITIPSGNVYINGSDENAASAPYPWKNAVLNINGQYGKQWMASSSVDFMSNGQFKGNITLDEQQNLSGNISAKLNSIAALDTFVPQLSHVDGRLDAHVNVSGTLINPSTQLNATLTNAQTHIPALGLNLQNINLQANSSKPQYITLKGSVDSKQGQLQLEGALKGDLINDWHLSLKTKGEHIELVNLSEVNAIADPDLNWEINRKQLDIQGKLHIPKAAIEIIALPPDAVDISNDVVIVNEKKKSSGATPYIISNRIHITLGDEVHFQGLGFNSALNGHLSIQEKASQPTQAFGELLMLKGVYKAYGQTLAIEDGSKLIFQGPYNNPNLKIRSIRHTENITVGIEVSGTLKKPQSRLFSTPALPDTEIIAILLTGKPLSSASKTDANVLINAIATLGIEKGSSITKRLSETFNLDIVSIENQDNLNQSSLLLGKYLTPRLLVRYAVGLFDQSNNLGLEYQINKKLKLEAQSGTQQSIDLIYKVER